MAAATLALKGSGSIANSADVAFSFGNTAPKFDISKTTVGASVAALFSFVSGGVVSLGSTDADHHR